MKTILFLLLFLTSCRVFADGYTAIKGRVLSDNLNQVELYRTVDGKPQLYISTEIAADGSYGFLFRPEAPGFYAVGGLRNNFIVYVKGGEEINLDIYCDKALLNGKNTDENRALYLWKDYAAQVCYKSICFQRSHSVYEDFFPAYGKFLEGLPEIRTRLKSGNEAFDKLLQKMVDYEKDYFATFFLQTPRLKHPQRSEWPGWYDHIVSVEKYNDDTVLAFPWGVDMLTSYARFCAAYTGIKFPSVDARTEECFKYIGNRRLRGEFLLNWHFIFFKNYSQYLYGMKRYGENFVTASQKNRAEAVGAKLFKGEKGALAADFTYPDVNGKMVSLSDFKGKVVLVDVWATWCGPCKAQIPHLIRLEKEMRGSGLVVMGVSVNEEKDKKKWLDFIKSQGLGGVQLFAGGWRSKITKNYKITGIPRFMVFDKQGRIVSVNAPRPSQPELKALLEAELKK